MLIEPMTRYRRADLSTVGASRRNQAGRDWFEIDGSGQKKLRLHPSPLCVRHPPHSPATIRQHSSQKLCK